MKLFRRRLWDDEKRFGPMLIRPGDAWEPTFPGQTHGLIKFGRMPPTARSTEIKLALTLMGSVATGMEWPWPPTSS